MKRTSKLLLAAVLCFAAPEFAGAQTPKRPATDAEIAAAAVAMTDGVAEVSRNPSAFTQIVTTKGCAVTLQSSRKERADSVVERYAFDAGALTSHAPMEIDATTGAIMFRFETRDRSPVVTRSIRRISADSQPATDSSSTRVANVLVLAANTSQQRDVVTLMNGWTKLLKACGGDTSSQ